VVEASANPKLAIQELHITWQQQLYRGLDYARLFKSSYLYSNGQADLGCTKVCVVFLRKCP
jgi:hypothetical protein